MAAGVPRKTQDTEIRAMNEQDFQTKLNDLMQQLDSLPSPAKEQLQQMATETRERHNRMKKTVNELQDSLDYLRLSIKYLVFDLEATRRENQYLRKLLDSKNHPQDREGGSSAGGDAERPRPGEE
jgi:chromosome segregation ATPase